MTRFDADTNCRAARRSEPPADSGPKKVTKVTMWPGEGLSSWYIKEMLVTEKGNPKVIKITFLRKSLNMKE
jgi:hypothetical protein